MTESMVERVAQAIHDAANKAAEEAFPGRLRHDTFEESWACPVKGLMLRMQARAAIEAMRKPTQKMIDAGDVAVPPYSGPEHSDSAYILDQMLTAALEEGK